MYDLLNGTEKLLDMLTGNDMLTYEGYCKGVENPIDRTQWDALLVILGSKQMLLSGSMKNIINNLKTICNKERGGCNVSGE
jgi:hypothetical protein